MATRSERTRADAQRKGPSSRTTKAKKAAAAAERSSTRASGAPRHAAKRAGKKATYTLEAPSAEGRKSRKSTRGSENRAKPDAQLNAREALQKGSPTARYRKAHARAERVRGRTAPEA